MSIIQDRLALGDHPRGSIEVDVCRGEESNARVVVLVVVPVEERVEVIEDVLNAPEALGEIRMCKSHRQGLQLDY